MTVILHLVGLSVVSGKVLKVRTCERDVTQTPRTRGASHANSRSLVPLKAHQLARLQAGESDRPQHRVVRQREGGER